MFGIKDTFSKPVTGSIRAWAVLIYHSERMNGQKARNRLKISLIMCSKTAI